MFYEERNYSIFLFIFVLNFLSATVTEKRHFIKMKFHNKYNSDT